MDIETVISMAPGLTKLYVFLGNNTDDILGQMITNSEIQQFSSSWGMNQDQTAEQDFQIMQVQGQSFFDASGDGDAYVVAPIPNWPADDPNVTSVGGTTLTMYNNGTAYISYDLETVWNDGQHTGQNNAPWWGNGQTTNDAYWGSGGGVSSTYPIPLWQQSINMTAVGGSSTRRNFPDVAMPGVYVWSVYENGLSTSVEGTSCAAPLWAGFTALVNQQAAAQGKPSVGFLNPAIYAIGQSQYYTNAFHDITQGSNTWSLSPNSYFAAPGFDLCTGWGSPNGQGMIDALVSYAGPVFVDFNYTGTTNTGTFDFPFKTLAQGVNTVSNNGTILIRTAGSSPETMTISKPMTIKVIGGPATVGH
jgi:subtilase family serine protease